MWAMTLPSGSRVGKPGLGLAIALLLGACQAALAPEDQINLTVHQRWQLQAGDTVRGVTVVGGLGDLALALRGQPLRAPFDGLAQLDPRQCLIFSSPDVPAYRFRICGLRDRRLGQHRQGAELGRAETVYLAALRKQTDGTWAIVEPSKSLVERFLQ